MPLIKKRDDMYEKAAEVEAVAEAIKKPASMDAMATKLQAVKS